MHSVCKLLCTFLKFTIKIYCYRSSAAALRLNEKTHGSEFDPHSGMNTFFLQFTETSYKKKHSVVFDNNGIFYVPWNWKQWIEYVNCHATFSYKKVHILKIIQWLFFYSVLHFMCKTVRILKFVTISPSSENKMVIVKSQLFRKNKKQFFSNYSKKT